MQAAPPNWRHLVDEFRARPLGRHSPDLQELLNSFRAEPLPGKPFLYMVKQHQRWALAHFNSEGPLGFAVDFETTFDTIEAAEWAVFRQRWNARFGFDPAEN
jgi:hypothetical protein